MNSNFSVLQSYCFTSVAATTTFPLSILKLILGQDNSFSAVVPQMPSVISVQIGSNIVTLWLCSSQMTTLVSQPFYTLQDLQLW